MPGPQDYAQRIAYRAPARWYAWLNRWLGVGLAASGLAPGGVVCLAVRGRRSGKVRRVPVVRVTHAGQDFLVALAGESQWVRNVRAAAGEATLRRGRARRVHLDEVPTDDRATVIAAYLEAGRRRGGEPSAQRQACSYFGLGPDPTVDEIAGIVDFYPVFHVTYADRGG